MRGGLFDLLRRYCISVRACEYVFGSRKLSRISLVLPAGYEGTEWVLIPKDVISELERELKLRELVLRLCYGKHLSASFYRDIKNSLDLGDKVELSYRVIKEALRVMKMHCKSWNIAVAFSGGKASLVTLKLVVDVLEQQDPELLRDRFFVCYIDTGNEYPENTPYVIKVVKRFFKLPRLIITCSRIKPFQLWREYGFPPESRYHHWEPICCKILKKTPAALVVEKFRIDLEFLGILTFESRARIAITDRQGLLSETQRIGGITIKKWFYRCMPIAFWDDTDIWMYIEKEKLPVNPLYERYGVPRQGCMFCTNHLNWHKQVRHILCNVLKRPQTWEWFIKKYREWGIQERKHIPISEVLRKFNLRKFNNKTIEEAYTIEQL